MVGTQRSSKAEAHRTRGSGAARDRCRADLVGRKMDLGEWEGCWRDLPVAPVAPEGLSAVRLQRALGLYLERLASSGRGGRMRRLTISDFKREILSLHGAHARIVSGESAIVRGAGETLQEVLVLIFELLDHPTARRCYAWEVDGRAMSVLHTPSVDSPQAALQSALEAES